MAAPTVRGVGTMGSGTTSCVIPVPTSSAPQAGDALYIYMESTDSTTAAGTPTTPNGWTKLFENTIGAGATNVSTLTIFGKIAGASESDVTVNGVGDHCAGNMIAIAGHGLGAITDTVVGTAADHGTSTANLLAPSITVTANSLIMTVMGLSDDAADLTNASGFVNANLANIVEQTDRTVSTGAGGGVALYTSTCAGTSTGTSEWDHDTAVNSQSVQLGVPPLSIVSGDGSAAGVATATAVGTGIISASGSSAGVATATGTGASTAAGVGSAAGVATVTGVGDTASGVSEGAGAAAGTSTAAAIGASTALAVGSAAGAAAAAAVGGATSAAVGAAAGASTASGVGFSIWAAVGQAAGTAVVLGVSSEEAPKVQRVASQAGYNVYGHHGVGYGLPA